MLQGCPINELIHQHPLPISPKGYAQLLQHYEQTEDLFFPTKGICAKTGFSIQLTSQQQQRKIDILQKVKQSKLEGMALSNFSADALVTYMINTNELLRIQNQLLASSEIHALFQKLDQYFNAHKVLTPNAFKDHTQLSRKYAIPLLEWLDQQGYTIRTEEGRIKRSKS